MNQSPTPEMAAAALAALPGVGPARLAALLERWTPAQAWARVLEGRAVLESAAGSGQGEGRGPVPGGDAARRMAERWRHAAERVDFDELARQYRRCGVGVVLRGAVGYPSALVEDPEPPPALFWRGDLAVLEGTSVAIVGARRCTGYGRDVARALGQGLAEAGVRVVSGLALGIDGAAHEGVLRAHSAGPLEPARAPWRGSGGPRRESGWGPPIAVVGGGLDCVYPSRHATLWARVEAAGVIVSEAPLAAAPAAWRFPLRNRIIAGLADVVVVVESYLRGGSRHTVDAAAVRDKTVLAVPGPVHSAASALPHQLLHDGCGPARDVGDVLVALGLARAGEPVTAGEAVPDRAGGRGPRASSDPRPPPGRTAAILLGVLGWESLTLEQLVMRSGLSPSEASVGLALLEQDGWVRTSSGRWEQVGPQTR
ncbi:MAG: DNA-processing protein DprA [Acidimicrobiales bacterium]